MGFTKHSARLITTAALLTACLIGCDSNPVDPALDSDNPFDKPTQAPETITILSCRGYLLELPNHIQITELAGWPLTSTTQPQAIDENSRKLWAQNGLHLMTAPLDTWPQCRDQLTKAGAQAIYDTQFLLRNPLELAEFDTAWHDADVGFFVADRNNKLRGYTASPGTCFIRFNALPLFNAPDSDLIKFNLVPVFKSDRPRTTVSRQEDARFQVTRENQIIVFEQMLLSGTMDTQSFLAIAISGKNEAIGNLGRYFLKTSQDNTGFQRMLFLVPNRIEAKKNTTG